MFSPKNGLIALVIALFALTGCSSNPQPGYEPMSYAQACVDEFNNRAPDEFCDGHRPHYYQAWGSIYDDGYYVPSYGRPMNGWSRQRPRNYNPKTTIININGAGGTLNRAGSGTGVTTRSRIAGGGTIPTPPKGVTGVSGGRVDQAKAGGISTIQRGGLGVTGSKSTSSKSSGSKSSSSKGGK